MGINEQEWKELTESKFWRPEVGKQYNIVISEWHYEKRAFKEDQRTPREDELRPTFVASVTNINGMTQHPAKEFTSSNKQLNRLLMQAVKMAETQGRDYLKVMISRSDARTYTLVDLAFVDHYVPRPASKELGKYDYNMSGLG